MNEHPHIKDAARLTAAESRKLSKWRHADALTAIDAVVLASRTGMDLLDATILAAQRLGRTSLTR